MSAIDCITYFNVSQLKEDEVTKKICNSTPFKITIRSKSYKNEPPQEIGPGEQIYYAQNFPNKSGSVILLQIHQPSPTSLVSPMASGFGHPAQPGQSGQGSALLPHAESISTTLEIDFLIITPTPKYFDLGHSSKLVETSVKFVGANKVIDIKFTPKNDIVRQNIENQRVFEVRFGVNIIDLSFMCLRRKEPRIEMANVFLSNTMGIFEIRNNTNVTFAGFIDHFQIDNNSNKTNFPVVIRKIDEKHRKNIEKKRFFEWNVAFENPSMSTHLYFSNVVFALGNLEAYFEEEYVDLLIDYASRLSTRAESEKMESHFDFVKKKYFAPILAEDNFDYNKKIFEFTEIDVKNNYVYIDNLNLPQIRCLFSYFQDPSSTVDKDFALVSLIGVAVGGFENANIELKGLHKE